MGGEWGGAPSLRAQRSNPAVSFSVTVRSIAVLLTEELGAVPAIFGSRRGRDAAEAESIGGPVGSAPFLEALSGNMGGA